MAIKTAERLMKMRRICGYGAAIAVTPYLLIKIAWTFGFFLPTEQMGEASWRGINAATAVIAAVGFLLAMAFCRPWGERLPAWMVALPVWLGTGLLVPLLLLARLSLARLSWLRIRRQVPPASGFMSKSSLWSLLSESGFAFLWLWQDMPRRGGLRRLAVRSTAGKCRDTLGNCRPHWGGSLRQAA
ncbi:hypothetical protein KIS1582_3453 [Cytobacillus firmus]|uniref:Uncharacterized protein n=1 Tax=Cytobacillus firmus TaxID=1399 RepID=A0A800N9P7_CYTFI|nr:hypothetical protein KIS1582_3453 [Cytobacillus firmus]